MGRVGIFRFATLASLAALVMGACGSGVVTPSPTPAVSPAPSVTPMVASATPNSVGGWALPGAVVIRWLVGFGPGTAPAQIATEDSVVDDFNAQQDKTPTGIEGLPILLSLEIVPNDKAVSTLTAEAALNNPPDVIGPISVADRAGFAGEFMDMTPLIKVAGYDTSVYPPAPLNAMRDRTGALLGLPYAVYPSYIVYNRDLFDAAGLAYPPTKIGDEYTMPDGRKLPWNWDTVRTLAMRLSLDKYGRNATQPGFDPSSQVQFGVEFQDTDARALASAFGSGSLVGADGRTAQFPDAWKAAWYWYYNGIWTDHFIATAIERNSDLLDDGNPIASGRVAMGVISQDHTCCTSAESGKVHAALKHWDIAPMPANAGGVTTAPIDYDTFVIDTNSADAPDAFQAIAYIMSRMDLLAAYGGIPATGDRLGFLHGYVDPLLAKQFPGNTINWQVALDMESYADSPNHAAELPNDAMAVADYGKLFSTLATTPGLDLDAVFAYVTAELQADFNAAA